jgi:hypothetical protein
MSEGALGTLKDMTSATRPCSGKPATGGALDEGAEVEGAGGADEGKIVAGDSAKEGGGVVGLAVRSISCKAWIFIVPSTPA